VTSEHGRVRLRAVPASEVYQLLGGQRPHGAGVRLHEDYPLVDTLDAMAMLVGAHQVMAPRARISRRPRWWIHQVVVENLVVGDIGFHGPPGPESPRTVEIGYGLVRPWRGQGVATRACALVLQTAWADGADLVVAETEPGNLASQRVLLNNDFRRRADGTFVISRSRSR
jgi:hypothetical protein